MKRMFEQRSYQELKSEDEARKEKPIYSKVSLFGPSGSGKTRLARALLGAPGSEKTESTIGCSYYEDNADKHVKLQLWDIGGAERIESLWRMYLRGCEQVVLTFDSEDAASFADLGHYYDKIHKFALDAKVVLVGTYQNGVAAVSDEAIQAFMREHAIQECYPIDVNNEDDVHTLRCLLFEQSQPKPILESSALVQAKELAKESIEMLRSLMITESDENAAAIQFICKILDDALLSSNLNSYFNLNADLLQEYLEKLRYSGSSLYSTAYNAVATVLVCGAILATGFVAFHWLNKILKENYATKGDYLLFSTSGAKQLAQEALHKTSHSTSPGKK